MRTSNIGAFSIAALCLASTACAKDEPVVPLVPAACILASRDDVRKDTQNPNLVGGGATWNKLGGSKCTYKDGSHPETIWSFEDDPSSAAVRALRESEGFTVKPATAQIAGDGKGEGTKYLLIRSGQVYGLVLETKEVTITVIGPPQGAEDPLRAANALALTVRQGYDEQKAVAVSGQ